MPTSDRDFLESIKREIENRAGSKCSNPECRALTKGPKSDETGIISVGEAAHIEGAQPGSARYNPSLSDDECKGAGNAVWLCVVCHTKIDRDAIAYPAPLLREWRRGVEAEASAALGKPNATNRAAVLRSIYTDLLDSSTSIHTAKNMLDGYSALNQKERAELFDKFVTHLTGSMPERNPYKRTCDGCNNQFYGSELTPKEVTIYFRIVNGRMVPDTQRFSVCSSCCSPDKWPKQERNFQNLMVMAENRNSSQRRQL